MIKGIQLLRAIAALAVVFYHCHFLNMETGTFGVDIFFVISGFIIAYMVNQNTDQFLLKRAIRVVPLYALATLLTIALVYLKPQWFNHVIVNTEAVVKSFLFIPYEMKESGPILSLGWTLNNEMFFYLVMAICILCIRKKQYLVPACASFLVLLLLILNAFAKQHITDLSYILRFYRNGLLPEFVYGLLLYYFWTYGKTNHSRSIKSLMIAVGILAFFGIIYMDLTQTLGWLPRNVRYGIPSVLFVNALLLLENRINANNIFVRLGLKLGDASYAMYLFHPFIIHFLIKLVYPSLIGSSPALWVKVLELGLALVLVSVVSIIIFELVDKPSSVLLKKFIRKQGKTLSRLEAQQL